MGTFIAQWGTEKLLKMNNTIKPIDIAVDSSSGNVYVTASKFDRSFFLTLI